MLENQCEIMEGLMCVICHTLGTGKKYVSNFSLLTAREENT